MEHGWGVNPVGRVTVPSPHAELREYSGAAELLRAHPYSMLPGVLGGQGTRDTSLRIGDSHLSSRHRGASLVRDGARNTAGGPCE